MDFVVSGYDSVKFRKTYHKNNTGQRLIGHTDVSFHENVFISHAGPETR